MAQTTQYFFSIEKLRNLLQDFDNGQPAGQVGARTIRGFVFTPGLNAQTNEPSVFAFPLFSLPDKPTAEDAVIVQNLSVKYSGCPYPPPCN